LIGEDVQHRFFEGGIRGMSMIFPAAIGQIYFDATSEWLAPVHPNGGIPKIGPGFAIPGAKLHDVDFITARGDEAGAEFSCEPTRLDFQLRGYAPGRKQSAFSDSRGGAHLRVTIGEQHRI
jgi:hypothetical protein